MTTQEIVNDPFSSYKHMSAVRHICLPPRYLGNVSQGIRDQLDSEINFYCTDLDSVVISYEKLKLLQAVGSILDDSPFLHFEIQADYIVFKPTIGCILKGIVNKVSKDHVGCLVHDRFNASIHRPRQNVNGWRGSHLQQGEEFPFEVLDIYSNNAVISLKGKLVDQKVIEAYLKSLKTESYTNKTKNDTHQKGDYVDTDEGEITLDNEPVVLKKRKRSTSSQSRELHDTVDGVEKPGCDSDLPQSASPKKRRKGSPTSEVSDTGTPTNTKTYSAEGVEELATPVLERKRKHSLESGSESILRHSFGVSSSKKVRFDDSILDFSTDAKKKTKKKGQISPIEVNDSRADHVDVHDGSYLDSSVFDESHSPAKDLRKKKKHKKAENDISQEEPTSEWVDYVSKKKKKKKKTRKDDDMSNSESSDGQSLVLRDLAEGFGKIVSDVQSSQKSKKKKNKEKDLIDVVLALQSEVTKAASKIITPSSSSKKKKQKKKKNRDSSSSPERDSTDKTSKSKSKRTSDSSVLGCKDTVSEVVDSDRDKRALESTNDLGSKKRNSAMMSDLSDVTSKKKKKIRKEKLGKD